MDDARHAVDAGLDALADAELARLARGDGSHPAAHVLFHRHHDWMGRVLAFEGRRCHLSRLDFEDAQQATLWEAFCYALVHFDPLGGDGRGRFRTYFEWVLRSRLDHAIRSLHRQASHFDRTKDVHQLIEQASGGHGNAHPSVPADPLPDQAVQDQESREQLQRVLRELPHPAAALLTAWASGIPMGRLAKEYGVCARTVSRWIHRFLKDLRSRLGSPAQ